MGAPQAREACNDGPGILVAEMIEYFIDAPFYDDDLLKLAVRFAHDLFFLGLVVYFGLKPGKRSDPEFAFTAVLLNVTVFFICFTLKKLDLGLGMAIGLFAIFGVLRYRTDTIRAKEMTYLFVVIGIAIVNALTNKKTSYLELLAVNGILFGAVLFKEYLVTRLIAASPPPAPIQKPRRPPRQTLIYDNLQLLASEHRDALIEDLRRRTGLHVTEVQIGEIDLTTSTVRLGVSYEEV